MVDKDQQKMSAIVAWTAVIPSIGSKNIRELVRFGQRYGVAAMVPRAKGMMSTADITPQTYLQKIKSKISFLSGMHRIWKNSVVAKRNLTSLTAKQRMRARFVQGFRKQAEPLVRSMLTLAFTQKVLEVYLSREEILAWTGITSRPSDLATLKSTIEVRSGQKVAFLMKNLQKQVEEDLFQMWAANLSDGHQLASDPRYRAQYQKALEQGNVAELTAFFMKGKQ